MSDERLMWANDVPHPGPTWPWSQGLLAEHTAHLTDEERTRVLPANVAGLDHPDLAA